MEINKFSHSHHKSYTNNTRHSSAVSFDSFLFVDNVTNSRIVLKEARKHYEKNKSLQKNKMEEKQQLNTLNQCLSTLKSTKLFQMDSLRSKIFKSTHTTQTNNRSDIQQAKRGIRHLIQTSIKQLSLKELRQCFSNPNHRIDPKIIALQSLASHQLTKQNIQSLVQDTKQKERVGKQRLHIDHHHAPSQDFSAEQFKQQKSILQQANNYLLNHLKTHSTHLVKPKYHRQLYQQLYSACSRKRVPKKAFSKPTVANQMNQGVFKPLQKCETIKKLESKNKQKVNNKSKIKEIIFAVQNNLFFDVQTLIMMDKQLIYSLDGQGNNLLHIASKNRNEQLFSFILKKAGGQLLYSKNNLGRTPLDLAKLYAAHPIVKMCENYSPYSYS